MARQQAFKDMENPHGDDELDAFAEAFKRSSKRRKKAQDDELAARSILIDAMKKKKLTVYEDRRVDPPLQVTLVAQEKIKVEAIDELAGDDDGEDIEEAEDGEQKASKKRGAAEAA